MKQTQPGSALTMADALSPEDSEKMKKIRERSRAKKERNTGFDGHVTAEATARLYGLANRTAMDVRSTPLEKTEHSEFYNDLGKVVKPTFDDKNHGVVAFDAKLNPGS